jgi:hypothetical protein
MIKTIATVIIASALSFNASAALIEQDLFVSGDNLLTLDTDTGLRWMDLSLTFFNEDGTGLSYDAISQRLLDTEDYLYGFRYATAYEVEQLYSNAGLEIRDYYDNTGNDDEVMNLINLMSFTQNNSTSYHAFGITGSECVEYGVDCNSGTDLVLSGFGINGSSMTFANPAFGSVPSSHASNIYGHYLVEVQAVPVPAAVWLFGSGLLALAGISRRKTI